MRLKPGPIVLILALVVPCLAAPAFGDDLRTAGACSPLLVDVEGTVEINVSCPTGLTPLQLEEIKEAIVGAISEPPAVVAKLSGLSERFGVQKSALRNFFKTLARESVEIDDLDQVLREVARRPQERQPQLVSDRCSQFARYIYPTSAGRSRRQNQRSPA